MGNRCRERKILETSVVSVNPVAYFSTPLNYLQEMVTGGLSGDTNMTGWKSHLRITTSSLLSEEGAMAMRSGFPEGKGVGREGGRCSVCSRSLLGAEWLVLG